MGSPRYDRVRRRPRCTAADFREGIMALVACFDCGCEVPTEAFACPACGAPRPVAHGASEHQPTRQRSRWRVVLYAFLVLIAISAINSALNGPARDTSSPAPNNTVKATDRTSSVPAGPPLPTKSTGDLGALMALVAEARLLQTPTLALDFWGDPTETEGVASPTLRYRRFVQDRWFRIQLSYAPRVRGSRRLAFMIVWPDKSPSDTVLREWFGPPTTVANEYGARSWRYNGKDAAKLRVTSVELLKGGGVWIVLDGQN